MSTDYTNREIEGMFKDIKDSLERIEAQVLKTNGRVTALEFWKEGLMARLGGIASAIAITWVLIKEFIIQR